MPPLITLDIVAEGCMRKYGRRERCDWGVHWSLVDGVPDVPCMCMCMCMYMGMGMGMGMGIAGSSDNGVTGVVEVNDAPLDALLHPLHRRSHTRDLVVQPCHHPFDLINLALLTMHVLLHVLK